MSNFENIIWDVSGTLWDDKPQVIWANLNVLNENGITHIPRIRSLQEEGEELTYSWLERNLVGSAIECFRSFGLEGEDRELEELYKTSLEKTCLTIWG